MADKSVGSTRARAVDADALRWVDPTELTPWERNPRVNDHAVQAVAESIQRFGFSAPIVARTNGQVIAGHTRLKAALRLELDRVPVRYLDLPEHEAHLLALADNRLGEDAEWDYLELERLTSDLDLTEAGFSTAEIDEILSPVEEKRRGYMGPMTVPPSPRLITVQIYIDVRDTETIERALVEVGGTRGDALLTICSEWLEARSGPK